MFGLLRFIGLMLIMQTIVYLILWARWRNAARRSLEEDWQSQGQPGNQDDFVDQGLAEFGKQRRTVLFLLVYVAPICIVATIIYLTNFH